MELLGIARNCKEFLGILRNSYEFLGIPWNSQEFLDIPRDSSGFLGISRDSLEFLDIPEVSVGDVVVRLISIRSLGSPYTPNAECFYDRDNAGAKWLDMRLNCVNLLRTTTSGSHGKATFHISFQLYTPLIGEEVFRSETESLEYMFPYILARILEPSFLIVAARCLMLAA